jgi:hypothetical protein
MGNATPHRSPGVDDKVEEIPNPYNRSPVLFHELSALWLLSVWCAERCFGRASIRAHRKTPFGDQEVTDSIGRLELEPVFDAWEWRLGECIQMKSEYIA